MSSLSARRAPRSLTPIAPEPTGDDGHPLRSTEPSSAVVHGLSAPASQVVVPFLQASGGAFGGQRSTAALAQPGWRTFPVAIPSRPVAPALPPRREGDCSNQTPRLNPVRILGRAAGFIEQTACRAVASRPVHGAQRQSHKQRAVRNGAEDCQGLRSGASGQSSPSDVHRPRRPPVSSRNPDRSPAAASCSRRYGRRPSSRARWSPFGGACLPPAI